MIKEEDKVANRYDCLRLAVVSNRSEPADAVVARAKVYSDFVISGSTVALGDLAVDQ